MLTKVSRFSLCPTFTAFYVQLQCAPWPMECVIYRHLIGDMTCHRLGDACSYVSLTLLVSIYKSPPSGSVSLTSQAVSYSTHQARHNQRAPPQPGPIGRAKFGFQQLSSLFGLSHVGQPRDISPVSRTRPISNNHGARTAILACSF